MVGPSVRKIFSERWLQDIAWILKKNTFAVTSLIINHYRWNLNQRRVSLPFRTWAHSLWYWNAIDSKLSIIPIFENWKLFSFQTAKENRNKTSPHTTEPSGNVVNTVSVRNIPRARKIPDLERTPELKTRTIGVSIENKSNSMDLDWW